MIKPTIKLQELRRKIYVKAKAEKTWKFWGLYTHICKLETLHEAYKIAKRNNGASGIDGLDFSAIEEFGVQEYLVELREELINETYKPMRNRKHEIPKGNDKVRKLSIPTIRDRIVQGAVKLILEPVYEADFQKGSYGYRPKRTAHEAIHAISNGIVKRHTRVIDIDLKEYFDTVRHDILITKVAERMQDRKVLHLLKLILKASGKCGVPQGGVISPLLSNIYLNEVDKMLEKAIEITQEGKYVHLTYARFADDLVILVDGHCGRWKWLEKAVYQRVCEELAKLKVELNKEKTQIVDLEKGENFTFLGFCFWQCKTLKGVSSAYYVPSQKARKEVIMKLKQCFRRQKSQSTAILIATVNKILRGWTNYFKIGHSARCFSYIKRWVEKKLRRHLSRAMKKKGFGWKRWSTEWIYNALKLYNDYRVSYVETTKA